MSRGAKSGGGGGGGSGKGGSLFAGVVLGMVLGLAVAGGVAWFILKKNPSSFENKERHEASKAEVKSEPLPVKSAVSASAPLAASAVGEQPKQHFEFYKVLTDKDVAASQKSAEKAPAAAVQKPAQTVAPKETFYVQAGSFPKQDDAEKLKAKLALLGLEASVYSAEIPEKGTYHRVRLGPFRGSDELNKALVLLKQNGVTNATSSKAQ